jgi:large subunit ribosomal protein L17
MKKRVQLNELGRKTAHRKALLRNLANALIKRKRIKTTKAKAKELRRFVEPLVTRAKENTLHNRRIVYSRIRNKEALVKLFEDIAPKHLERPGGYTRIYLLGQRKSDGAEMSLIEFVGEEFIIKQKKEKKDRTKKAAK